MINRLLNLLLLFLCTNSFLLAQNQITVTPLISPPFSPYLEDYLNLEGGLLLVQNNTNETQNIMLTGRVEGDNGLWLQTDGGYRPSTPIVLTPFETLTILANDNSLEFVDLENIETNATQTQKTAVLITGVLPEGNYTYCIRALDFNTMEPLSPEFGANCAFITISYPEPPILIHPVCEMDVDNEYPVFTWSPPVGNTGMSQILYDLYLVRVRHSQVPNDVMNNAYNYRAGNPVIRENLMVNSYAYLPSDPPLQNGKTYVWMVVAKDAAGKLIFQNDGKSEICTFKYKIPSPTPAPNPPPVTPGVIVPVIPPTHFAAVYSRVSGRLVYQFHPAESLPGSTASASAPAIIPPQTVQTGPPAYSATFLSATSSVSTSFGSMMAVSSGSGSSFAHSSGTAATYVNPNPYPIGAKYYDDGLYSANNGRPLKNVSVRLVERAIHKVNSSSSFSLVPKYIPVTGLDNGKTIASATTDAGGNYQFVFVSPLSTGLVSDPLSPGPNIYRVYMLEVVSPYYYSPDIKILAQPGEALQLPDQVAFVRNYNLKVIVKRNNQENQYGGKGTSLAGARVEITRPHFAAPPPAEIPLDEGQDLNENRYPITDIDGFSAGYDDLIAKDTVNAGQDSVILFQNLVMHNRWATNDRFKIKAFTQQGSHYIYKAKTITYGNSSSTKPFTKFENNHVLLNSDFSVLTTNITFVLKPKKPKISGRVYLQDTSIVITECILQEGRYFSNNQIQWLKKDNVFTDQDGYYQLDGISLFLQ